MRMVLVNGSPRKSGNTAFLLASLESLLSGECEGAARIFVHDADIGPCVDCRACFAGDRRCVRADGMEAVYEALEGADLLVLGSPIYWSGLTGQMKALVDRLRPYYRNRRLEGKRLVAVSVGASLAETDLVGTMYARLASALGLEFSCHVAREAFDADELEGRGFGLLEEERQRLGLPVCDPADPDLYC